MGKPYKDLTGLRFGKLLVIELYGKNKYGQYLWKCLCDCGNITYVIASRLITGRTLSCGCLSRERASLSRKIDLVGQRFGRLVVLREAGRRNGSVLWECICDCGNITYVTSSDLRYGSVKSCGCYKIDKLIERSAYDLVGQVFNRLTVKRLAYSGNGRVWECECACGNIVYVTTGDLISGHTQSCGCIQSKMEEYISRFLINHNIEFQRQKCFIGCKKQALLRFDFFLPDYGIAIEYDGEYHYPNRNKASDLEDQQKRDAIKTKYCEENDIILLRIPYWEKDNIESILTDWLFLYDAEDAISSDVDLSA